MIRMTSSTVNHEKAAISIENRSTYKIHHVNANRYLLYTAHATKYPECGRSKTCPVSLLRYITTDFVTYSSPHLSLYIPDIPQGSGGTPTVKSLARNEDTGLYVLFSCYKGSCEHTFTSTDNGLSFTICNITGVVSPDKDDLNIIYNDKKFVDMQIVWQTWKMKHLLRGICIHIRSHYLHLILGLNRVHIFPGVGTVIMVGAIGGA